MYTRETLLDTGKVSHVLSSDLLDWSFLLCLDHTSSSQKDVTPTSSRSKCGKRGGLHGKLLVVNVHSLENRMKPGQQLTGRSGSSVLWSSQKPGFLQVDSAVQPLWWKHVWLLWKQRRRCMRPCPQEMVCGRSNGGEAVVLTLKCWW